LLQKNNFSNSFEKETKVRKCLIERYLMFRSVQSVNTLTS